MVLSFEEALAVVVAQCASVGRPRQENVRLETARGRVLAKALMADRDQPPFDRSTRDGYAVRSADGATVRRIVGSVRAGEVWRGAVLGRGEAVELMTGAPLPGGADGVVMVEHVAVDAAELHVAEGRVPQTGENVVARGAEVVAGRGVLRAGTRLGAAEIAVAASCGFAEVPVYARPRVAIVATGDELVELDEAMSEVQIRNSNSYALAAQVEAEGGEAVRVRVARDTAESLRERMSEGFAADLLVLSGGVSMGTHDLVEPVLVEEFGAEFFFTGARIQPGKPVVFGRSGAGKYFFGLPGNPVSTQVTFALFVAPLLRAKCGRTDVAPQFVEARLATDIAGGAKVTRFLPAQVAGDWQGVTVRPVGWQGSGDVAANARGNAYVVLPAEVPQFAAGDVVRVLLR